jgi:polysaccharide export outer membrane protein
MKNRLLATSILAMIILAVCAFAQDAAQKPDQPQPTNVAAPDTSTNQQSSDVPSLKQRDPRYRLMKNDVLIIEFPFTSEYNETVTVQPDGFINLRQLPDLHVEGMTTPELTDALKKA